MNLVIRGIAHNFGERNLYSGARLYKFQLDDDIEGVRNEALRVIDNIASEAPIIANFLNSANSNPPRGLYYTYNGL